MKHLITGGCGFVGNLIARKLLEKGEEVITLDVWEAPDLPKELEFVLGSVTDREAVKRCMKGVDIVHHAAALVPLTKSGKRFDEVNAGGTRIVAEEAARANVKFLVHTSSSSIFGQPKCPVTNDSPLIPVEIYGESKLRAEVELDKVAASTELPVIMVRPRTIIGTGRLGIFQLLFEWIKEGRSIYVIGDGQNKLQFLHIEDLIDCYLFLCDVGKPGKYNVGTDDFSTLEVTLGNLIAHANTGSKIKHLPFNLAVATLHALDVLGLSPLAPYHYLNYGLDFYYDLTPLTELGWKPKWSNDAMFRDTYDYFVEHFDELKAAKGVSAHRKRTSEKILWLLKQIS